MLPALEEEVELDVMAEDAERESGGPSVGADSMAAVTECDLRLEEEEEDEEVVLLLCAYALWW
jgi:hypothetical protein